MNPLKLPPKLLTDAFRAYISWFPWLVLKLTIRAERAILQLLVAPAAFLTIMFTAVVIPPILLSGVPSLTKSGLNWVRHAPSIAGALCRGLIATSSIRIPVSALGSIWPKVSVRLDTAAP